MLRAAAGAGIVATALLTLPTGAGARPARAYSTVVPTSRISVSTNAIAHVPDSFLGLSMNIEEMEDFTNAPAFPRFVKLLTPDGEGPFVLRVGGTYADTTYWNGEEAHVAPEFRAPPANSVFAGQGTLDSLASVLRATGSDAILNVNAAAHDPQMALDFLEAAERTLPSGSLSAAAIGNEPDLYTAGYDGIRPANVSWVRKFSAYRYDTLFSLYATLLKRHLPTLPLAGPELAFPTAPWLASLIGHDGSQLNLATEHYYAYNACAAPKSSSYPALHKYFRLTNISQQTRQIARSAALAHANGLAYRLTELGSSTCLGLPEVNNTFATSLWGLGQLYKLVTAGVDGINMHLRANEPNSALVATGGVLVAEPLLYGMAAFASTLGPNAQLDQVAGTLPSNLGVWAVQSGAGFSVALINDTGRPQRVRVTMPTSLPMTVKALTAPSPWSMSASFGGQTIGPDGTWQGTPHTQTVTPVSGAYVFTVAPDSADVASTS